MNRREFIQASTLGVLACTAAVSEAPDSKQDAWCGRPMRWAHLAFIENDPGNYAPAFWLDYFYSIHADGACLSASRCAALYPAKIPLRHRTKWLGDSDPFGDLQAFNESLALSTKAGVDPELMLDILNNSAASVRILEEIAGCEVSQTSALEKQS